ncbi:hypothetical protein FEMY_20850 [Ferrovum myxofaciens]|uniref:Uncharacterized protein n=1 Tax=Ferrovum myxofaciens TaxID=416213 RepID=A0A149VW04_9PROT|nr:hypothetical protein FEMY_20850 [Ferrovum myxofaciens]
MSGILYFSFKLLTSNKASYHTNVVIELNEDDLKIFKA